MKIISMPNLNKLTTIGINAYCEGLIIIESISELDNVSYFLEKHNIRGYFIGKGSNLIPSLEYIPCFLIKMNKCNEFKVLKQNGKKVFIRADGGASLRRLIMWTMNNGFSGMEALAGIPGTIGGAVAMNAGSFGVDMSDLVCNLLLWHNKEGVLEIKDRDINFSYRKFYPPFKYGLWCVLAVDLLLNISNKDMVKKRIRENYIKKKTTQPVISKTCGCVFKNPTTYPAGYLLEKSGMKGKNIGDIEFSNLHANFLINRGKGTPAQAMELIEEAREIVFKNYGINLELEVKILSQHEKEYI